MPLEGPSKNRKSIPAGVWTKCEDCEQIIFHKELEENLKVCPKCNAHFRLTSKERIAQLFDPNSFVEIAQNISPVDSLHFSDIQPYQKRLVESQKKTGRRDACTAGEGLIEGKSIAAAVLGFEFMGGSMGSVVGEKITLAIELAIERRIPMLIISASGGARMQESILSLMQMAKTSAALAKLHQAKLPYISLLTDPTTGGVTASFAMLGDVIIAEPRALIAFAGPRVIEQTIRQQLPEGFQLSEFLFSHGMIDAIVHRRDLRAFLAQLLTHFAS